MYLQFHSVKEPSENHDVLVRVLLRSLGVRIRFGSLRVLAHFVLSGSGLVRFLVKFGFWLLVQFVLAGIWHFPNSIACTFWVWLQNSCLSFLYRQFSTTYEAFFPTFILAPNCRPLPRFLNAKAADFWCNLFGFFCAFASAVQVCGSNGVTYDNECRLRAENCETGSDVRVKYRGACCKL